MKYKIITILVILALSVFCVIPVRAQEVSDSSASITKSAANFNFDYRVENLRKYLENFNSPLSLYAQDFVTFADKNEIDYRLVPSIAGVESTFGKFIPSNSFNAYGWANGNYSFTSWPDSIAKVSETLKSGYIDKGAPTIAKIAKRYAPPSTTWGYNVKYFLGKIDSLPLNFDI